MREHRLRSASLALARLVLPALAVLATLPACATADPPKTLPPLEIKQDDLDDDERLAPDVIAEIGRVVRLNQAYLGAPEFDFCRRLSKEERASCMERVGAISRSEIAGPVSIEQVSELSEGGKEWPNAKDVSGFRRVRLSIPLAKQDRTAEHGADVVVFDSRRGDETERCVFPLEHWAWSEMDRRERFSQAPIGRCNGIEQTVTEYLVARAPDAAPVVLRFLSNPEAKAWRSRDPEKIKWDSPYTSGHPYAKYFLLDSLRWWRGGGGAKAPKNDGYAWAVRIDQLPLTRILELEKSGDVFLDVFEDGAQIELTNLTKKGLEAILAEKPAVLVDVSGPDDTAPRFEPFDD